MSKSIHTTRKSFVLGRSKRDVDRAIEQSEQEVLELRKKRRYKRDTIANRRAARKK